MTRPIIFSNFSDPTPTNITDMLMMMLFGLRKKVENLPFDRITAFRKFRYRLKAIFGLFLRITLQICGLSSSKKAG